jgi:DNA polymerase I-like protein with 3'-5' exonuclease and polymerase domains
LKVTIDIECNGLVNPTKIWVIVCKDIDTGQYYIWRNVTDDERERASFCAFHQKVERYVGHNFLGYDWPNLSNLLHIVHDDICSISYDTLVISKLIDYSRSNGHSIEAYGSEFGIDKLDFNDFSKYSKEMEEYCVRDVDICERIYNKYNRFIHNPSHFAAIDLEQRFQLVTNNLHNNGFGFSSNRATSLLDRVTKDLDALDKEINEAFPPREVLIREFTPKATKFGTISKTSVPRSLWDNIQEYEVGKTYRHTRLEKFNPSSHKQLVDVLTEAGWKPTAKTKTHIETEQEINRLKYQKNRLPEVDIRLQTLYSKMVSLKVYGWKIDEENLSTLPPSAPAPARALARRILLEARRRTLTEWISLVWHEIEIKHDYNGILGIETNGKPIKSGATNNELRTKNGAQTIWKNQESLIEKHILKDSTDLHRKTLLEWLKTKKVNVSSVKENANSTSITVIGQEQLEACCAAIATVPLAGMRSIPISFKIISQRIHGKFYGLGAWSGRMAHQEPNTANIPNEYDTQGKKKLLGKEMRSCWIAPKGRLLVGVDAEGIQLRIFAHYINDPEFTKSLVEGRKDDKTDPHSLNQRILGPSCKSRAAAKRFIYALLLGAGIGKLAEILVASQDETKSALERLMVRYTGLKDLKERVIPADAKKGWFSGLDNRPIVIPAETVGARKHLAMSGYLQSGEAIVMKKATLKWEPKLKDYDAWLVNFVHDEWQTECPNDVKIAMEIAKIQADSLKEVGEELGLRCPLAGSYWNDDHKDYTIGTNWSVTH